MPVDKPIFRFAPSPNGFLHLGHAYSALQTFEHARRMDGEVLLRIEDIDPLRSQEAFIAKIVDDLKWLGLSWPEPVLRQSTRFGAYRDAIDRLQALDVLYPCVATRSEIRAACLKHDLGIDPDGAPLYAGRGRVVSEAETRTRIEAGSPYALRIDMKRACSLVQSRGAHWPLRIDEMQSGGDIEVRLAQPQRWGDALIVRKDVPTSYHLAVVVDDAYQNISHVTRGQDLFSATDIQRLLQELLEISPPVYFHHPLLLDNSGKKLSKSDHATSLQSLREMGMSLDDLKRRVAHELTSSMTD